ncbi:DegT/DnrJ/EryC1/StrS family aminotransferase [Fontibacter flavus]|uniref:DegT/DnrJ/EryC1/StrS family aminotransferase n=1 Tax=Fontibacter flavus TaxID=654838 RepID=A0ABV6FV57_9BACT
MIKFYDLQKINQQYADELKQAAQEVIDSGWYLFGEKVKNFEKSLQTYLSASNVVTVGNGLDALKLIFQGYIEQGQMQRGDEVIVPANTYIATILSILGAGLMPVFAEPSINTYNLDLDNLESKISKRTKAIIIVHLYGRACWSSEMMSLAEKYGLKVIEDNAQAIGASWGGIKTGTLGHASACSFYPSKNLGALGDAGAVLTSDYQLAAIIRKLANYGSDEKYVHDLKGSNSRMDEIQAAFLDVKLKYLDSENQKRREFATLYFENISHPLVVLPRISDPLQNQEHVWHLFVIRTAKRDALKEHLLKNGIESLIHYPTPPYKQKALKEYSYLHFPITDKIHQEILSLPLSQVSTSEEIHEISEVINKFEQ